MGGIEWRERIDKQAAPHLITNELWSIPNTTCKTLLLLEVPTECGFSGSCGVYINAEPPYSGLFNEVPGAPATDYEFRVDYCSGLVCFASTAPIVPVCACYYGLGSLVWARDVNELGAYAEILDASKLNIDGTVDLTGNLDFAGYSVLNAACVSGICIAPHNHAGGAMGALISSGSAIADGSLSGSKLCDNSVAGTKLLNSTIGSTKLLSDVASLTAVSGGLLITSGTTLGLGRTQCNAALLTFKSDDNGPAKMYLYDGGSSDTFGFQIVDSGADRALNMFLPGVGTTNTLAFTIGRCGTALMSIKSCGEIALSSSAIRVNTVTNKVSMGTSALATAEQLEINGSILLSCNNALKIVATGGSSQEVVAFTAGNVLKIGAGPNINGLNLYGGGTARVCISAAGVFCGGLGNWGDNVTVGGAAPSDVRLYTQGCTTGDATRYSFIAADSTSNPILGVRNDCRVSIANANYDETLTVNGNTKVCGALVATGSMTATSYSSGGNISFTTSATINPTPGSFALCVCAQKLCIYGVGTTCGVFILPTGYSGSLTKGMLWVV
jgi:hypothetical protein